MFLNIKPHAGVFIAETSDASRPATFIPVMPLNEGWLQNLFHVLRIYPGKVGSMKTDYQPNASYSEIWPSLEGAHYLSFLFAANDAGLDEPFTLVFSEEGMGEYKRIIEDIKLNPLNHE